MWKTHLLLPYGAYRGGLHISINSFQLVLAEVHPLTLSITTWYVLSMSSCRSRVRLLGITGGPFHRYSRVYMQGMRLSRGFGTILTYYHSFSPSLSDYACVSVQSMVYIIDF